MHTPADHEPELGDRVSRGFLLLEAVVANVLLGVGIVAMVQLFAITLKANVVSEESLVASQLAMGLMEEVQLRRWDEKTSLVRPGVPVLAADRSDLGIDGGEDIADKGRFDDVDDFDGWVESPPRDPVNRTQGEMGAYERSVTVAYAGADLEPSAGKTDAKRVTVCVKHRGVKRSCMEWVAWNH